MEPQKNMVKFETYKAMHENLTRAMRAGFYYEAIFIEYAILEDRCTSALKHAGVSYQKKNGYDMDISQKLRKLADNPTFTTPFVRKRIPRELLDSITLWITQRNRLIHKLASIPYHSEEVEAVAVEGQQLVRALSKGVKSVNTRHDRERAAADSQQE